MKAEIKLNINKDLLDKAEQYAKEEGQALCEWQYPLSEDIDPKIEALVGIGGQLEDEENVNYKELVADAMSEKHLE